LVGVDDKEGRNISESGMILAKIRRPLAGATAAGVILAFGFAYAQHGPRGKSSDMPADHRTVLGDLRQAVRTRA
jgi:hypothetical protein